MTDAYEQPLCAMCDKPSAQLCAGCKSMKYCSKACQKLDWPIHKLVCKTYNDFQASRPDPEHYSMIYFAVDEPQPHFIWIRIDNGHNHPSIEELASHHIAVDRSESNGRPVVKALTVNAALDRPLNPHFVMFMPPSIAQSCPCCKDKYKANDSLQGVDTELADTLRGPILAWAVHLQDHLAGKSRAIDLAPMDFRHMVDELRFHYSAVLEDWHEAMAQRPNSKGISGVRLNCKGDQQFLRRPHLESYVAPVTSLSEQSLLSSPVAERLGMPLHVLKVEPAPLWRDRQLKVRKHNCCSGYLDPFVAMPDDIGSLIVVRKDGGVLKPQMLQAFFLLIAKKLEFGDTKPPFPLNRLSLLTAEDARQWTTAMSFLEMFDIVPDEVCNGAGGPDEEQEHDEQMND